MRAINKIIIHAAYTPPAQDIGVAEIRRWHTDPQPQGNGWPDIGYHHVIRRNGVVEEGRPIEQSGAHVAGHNHDSIGICLVGGDPVRAREWFKGHAGQGYDLLGLLGHVWRRGDGSRRWWLCSEAVGAALGWPEPWRFDPNALAAVGRIVGASAYI